VEELREHEKEYLRDIEEFNQNLSSKFMMGSSKRKLIEQKDEIIAWYKQKEMKYKQLVEQKDQEYQQLSEQKEELSSRLEQLEAELKRKEEEIQDAQQKGKENIHPSGEAMQAQQQPEGQHPFGFDPYNPSGSAIIFNPFKYQRKNP
jgi:chromosome segregation ATPase